MPSLDAPAMQRVVAICESTGLPFRMVPKLNDVLLGHSLPGELKEVAIEDLLGRKPILPDWSLIRNWLGGRTVLVTGAGGSIGSELCRQCARHGAGRIVLLEMSELLLLTIEAELKRVPGANRASVFGLPDIAMRVWLQPDRMAQLGISVQEVAAAMQSQNQTFGVGQIGAEPTPQGVQQTLMRRLFIACC